MDLKIFGRRLVGTVLCNVVFIAFMLAQSAVADTDTSGVSETVEIQVLRRLVQKNPDRKEYKVELAKALLQAGRGDESAVLWNELCRQPRRVPEVVQYENVIATGGAVFFTEDPAAAVVQKTAPTSPKAPPVIIPKAITKKTHNDALLMAAAQVASSSSRSANANMRISRQNPASSLLSHGDALSARMQMASLSWPESAQQLPRPVVEPEPETVQILLKAGQKAAADQKYAEAIPLLEKVVDQDPTLTAAWESLGWSCWHTGKEDKALALWERLRLLSPSNYRVYNLLGKAAVIRNQLSDALDLFGKSLQLMPDQPRVKFVHARLLRWTGDTDAAISAFTELQQDPAIKVDVREELARALLSNRNYEEALQTWQELRTQSMDNVDYMVCEAKALLHTGSPEQAISLANEVLARRENDEEALNVLVDVYQYGEKPEYALKLLDKLIGLAADPAKRIRLMLRKMAILEKMSQADSVRFPFNQVVQLSSEIIKHESAAQKPSVLFSSLRLHHAELLTLARDYSTAEVEFLRILADTNPQNRRALLGLFEIYLNKHQFDAARECLLRLHHLNPDNPYQFYPLARLEMAAGNASAAMAAIQKLEDAGRNGAVAVLLYHGLTTSDFSEILSVRRFRQHIQELKNAGFEFVTPNEITQIFNTSPVLAENASPPLRVCITFDDARRDAMVHGTEVAREQNIIFAMHVETSLVENNDPFFCTWKMLEQYQQTGCWQFGSHLHGAHETGQVDPRGELGYLLASRIWMPGKHRIESDHEYLSRIGGAYSKSKSLLKEKLSVDATFVAYPFGDVGQETYSNLHQPVHHNLELASRFYQIGFVQTENGYAVNGDNPHLYQRYSPSSEMTGRQLTDHLLQNHPVLLAQRLRAEFAAQSAKPHLAQKCLVQLAQNGYPEAALSKLSTYVQRQLMDMPPPADGAAGPRRLPEDDSGNAYVGAGFQFHDDNQDRTNWHVEAFGGVKLNDKITLEASAGGGKLKQDNAGQGAAQDYTVNEKSLSLGAQYRFDNGWKLDGKVTGRDFSGDADEQFLAATLAVEGKISPALAVLVQFEHDVVPSARAIVEDIDYDNLLIGANYKINDRWDVNAKISRFDFSDGNTRDHVGVGTKFMLAESPRWYIGFNYGYADSDQQNDTYWTPDKLHRYYAETGISGTYKKAEYSLQLRLGMGKENSDTDNGGWESIYGVTAAASIPITDRLSLNTGISYDAVPEYNALSVQSDLRYSF